MDTCSGMSPCSVSVCTIYRHCVTFFWFHIQFLCGFPRINMKSSTAWTYLPLIRYVPFAKFCFGYGFIASICTFTKLPISIIWLPFDTSMLHSAWYFWLRTFIPAPITMFFNYLSSYLCKIGNHCRVPIVTAKQNR